MTQCPDFLLGAGKVDTLSALHVLEFQISRRKIGIQPKPQGLFFLLQAHPFCGFGLG